jgi:hypothetical protein
VARFRNGLKTVLLLGALSALILLIGRTFGGTTGLLIAGVIALVVNGVSKPSGPICCGTTSRRIGATCFPAFRRPRSSEVETARRPSPFRRSSKDLSMPCTTIRIPTPAFPNSLGMVSAMHSLARQLTVRPFVPARDVAQTRGSRRGWRPGWWARCRPRFRRPGCGGVTTTVAGSCSCSTTSKARFQPRRGARSSSRR